MNFFRRHLANQLTAYCHGELPPAEAQRVAEHLRQCDRCRREHEKIEATVQSLRGMTQEAAPDSLWRGIESALDAPARPVGIPVFRFAAAAAMALLLIVAGLVYWNVRYRRPQPPQVARNSQPAWAAMRVEGNPTIDSRPMEENDRLQLGESLVTDPASRAQLSVGEIGEIELEPNSRLRLVAAQENNHRIALSRGKMQAVIWAPPRKFFVETPSALAVDLGCAYSLEVNDDGQSTLEVQVGIVAFESPGGESFIPQGAICISRPGDGLGTPYFKTASEAMQKAIAAFDTEKAGSPARATAIETILKLAGKQDALTLWHLLSRTEGEDRGRVYDRFAELVPPPPVITREGILAGNRFMLDAWGAKFELVDLPFWRGWKRPAPSK
jgi:hypothetical protein